MTKYWITPCVATLLAFAGTTAAAEVDANRVTAADLLALCAVAEDDDTHSAAMGFCYGYLDAVLDYHAALTAGSEFNAITCPPGESTRRAVSVALVGWAQENSAAVDGGPPVHVVMRAFAELWPCAED